jgi:GAF domain-containing protein
LSATISLARDVFKSDGYALWRVDDDGQWRMVRSFGVSDRFAARIVSHAASRASGSRVPFAEPLVCEDVSSAPMLSEMRDAYRAEGIASIIVFPLIIRGDRSGTLVFYSHQPCRYQDIDVRVGTALANLAASALTTAELYEEQRIARDAADHARQRAAFLAQAAAMLGASLDYEKTLKTVATLAVPTIADWCAVDIAGDRGGVHRLAVAHVDPTKIELARTLQDRYPADPGASGGAYEVIRAGKPIIVPRIPGELLDKAARDDEHRHILGSASVCRSRGTSLNCTAASLSQRARDSDTALPSPSPCRS